MEPIHLRFFYQEEEYARAAGVYQVKRGGLLRTYALYFVLIVGVFLAYGYYQGYLVDLLAVSVPILLTVAGFGSMFLILPSNWKKAFRADPRNRMPFTWDIDEQGVSITNDTTVVHFDWPFFREMLETEDFFFLVGVQNKNQLFFAPKRAFESAEQMERFREMARQFTRVERIG